MGINYNPRTVTDGLVLALDAGNAKSYPGSGTTWSDLSGNGNTGTFTNGPGYSGAAIQFDGTGDYLDVGYTSDLDLSSGDFTIEFFTYVNSYDTSGVFFLKHTGAGTGGYEFWASTDGTIRFNANGSTVLVFTGSGVFNLNQWNHIAVCLDSSANEYKLFYNGTLIASRTTTARPTFTSDFIAVGSYTPNTNYDLNGYISNLRITKGVARYTSNFTPPTAPFPSNSTDDSDYNNVSLLLYGTDLEDTSPTPKTITVNGDTNVNNNVGNPFSLVRSIDFDGTDDAVILGDILDDVTCGPDKKFSISVWVKYNTLFDTGNTLVSKVGDTSFSENQRQYFFTVRNPSNAFGSQQLEFVAYFALNVSSYAGYRTVGATIETGKWYNFVISYDGSIDNAGRYSLFIDGVSYPITTSFTAGSLGDIQNGNARLAIGALVGENVSNSPIVVTDGKIANVSIYNKALSASEVKQNFNALRGRFGV